MFRQIDTHRLYYFANQHRNIAFHSQLNCVVQLTIFSEVSTSCVIFHKCLFIRYADKLIMFGRRKPNFDTPCIPVQFRATIPLKWIYVFLAFEKQRDLTHFCSLIYFCTIKYSFTERFRQVSYMVRCCDFRQNWVKTV